MSRTSTFTRRIRPTLQRFEDRIAPATFTVTNVNNSGSGSLRSAIASANATSGSDDIVFSSLFDSPQTINLTTGEIDISNSVIINGPGSNLLTVSGGNSSRVFDVSGTGTPNVVISNLKIANGKVSGPGAGIRNQGESLALSNCVITNNVATGFSGGGISSIGGTLTIYRCTISGNTGGANGGGVDANSSATVWITESTVADNTATAQGGGVGVGTSSLTIESSTISGNTANGSGGGTYFAGAVGASGLTFRNSTFSGNTAKQNGGAIFLSNHSGTLVLQSCTLTANSATSVGGAIRQTGGTGAISIESCIVSGNTASSGNDISNTSHPATMKFSALGSTSGFTFSDLGGNLPAGADLKLTALIANGGLTETHNLLAGSPCIDAGSNPASMFTDQRGTGNPRLVNARADIGAVESQYLIVTNATNSGMGSLRQAVTDANAIAGVDAVSFDLGYFNVPRTITLTTGEILITDHIFIHGPSAAMATVSGYKSSRVFHINGTGTVLATINRLSIIDGKASGAGGGVLSAAENLTLNDCVLTGNYATGSGGGVSSFGGGTLWLNRCHLAANQAGANGGGVDANGGAFVTLLYTTVAGNSAAGQGGGVGVGSSSLLVDHSSVWSNAAGGSAGGVYFAGTVGANGLKISNSTISGNNAATNGGGMALNSFSGTLLVQSSTITANDAKSKGGGLSVTTAGAAVISLQSSIIAGNTAPVGPDVSSTTASAQACALGSINGIVTFTNLGSNLIGQDLKLGPLADNGGYTKTHALLPGSPCMEAGYNPSGTSTDQRGFIRIVGTATDIGTYEFQPGAKVQSVQVNDGSPQRSRVTSLTVTFDSAVTLPANQADAFQLRRQSDYALVALSASMMGNAVTLSFTGGPLDSGSLADGRYTLTVVAAQVNGGLFDGDGDGDAGEDHVLVGDPTTNKLFRLFGDADGSGNVSAADFAIFRSVFGTGPSIFDFNNDSLTNATDFAQFRARFGIMI